MFPTFSGNSRRPRQVNLSGQNFDPFASSSAFDTSGQAKNKTVLAAQLERLQRKEERERQSAVKNIQRVWRGYKVRKDLENERRQAYDAIQESLVNDPSAILPDELRLLLQFFNLRHQGDIQRLVVFADKADFGFRPPGVQPYFSRDSVQPCLNRLTGISLQSLNKLSQRSKDDEARESILRLLRELSTANPAIVSAHSHSYYKSLSRIVANTAFSEPRTNLLLDVIRGPLIQYIGDDRTGRYAYGSQSHPVYPPYLDFGLEVLTIPELGEVIGLAKLARIVDTKLLSVALLPALSKSNMTPIARLWLMANFIAICRLQPEQQGSDQFRVLSYLFSNNADKLVGRVDSNKTNTPPQTPRKSDSEDEQEQRPPALPAFVLEQVNTLVDKDSITTLCLRFQASLSAQNGDAALLANFAMTLLRVFQTRGDEIRMWLVYSSMSVNNSTLPAIKYFWEAARHGPIFRDICTSTKDTLYRLKELQQLDSHGPWFVEGQDWQIVMLFLELYAFALRFTDDEEFLAGGRTNDPQQPMSRFAKSALPLEEVQLLTEFLKNLAFTLIFHANDLCNVQPKNSGWVGPNGRYNAPPPLISKEELEKKLKEDKDKDKKEAFSGIPYAQVREIALVVLRAIYERDSRRPFLPTGHWLMTSQFDMGAFIPGVVAEEERQLAIGAGEVDDIDEEYEIDHRQSAFGSNFSRTVYTDRLQRYQRKQARQRALAVVGPRLEILQNMPFVIPFNTRVEIFDCFVMADQNRRRGRYVDPDHWRMSVVHGGQGGRELIARRHAKIRRQHIFEDAMDQYSGLGEGLKEPIQITFVDQFGAPEAGIDGGGVTKEFLTSITKEAFRTTSGQDRFITNDQNLLYPNPAALDSHKSLLRAAGINETEPAWKEAIANILNEYEFLGRIVGKCLYESILIDVSFAGFFLLTWSMSNNINYRANVNDLRDLDSDLYRGLLKLKNYQGDVENDLGLDFTIEDITSAPGEPVRTTTRELQPNGSNIPVTKENRLLYITLVTRHRLQVQPALQTKWFLHGLSQIIQPAWLSMFNQSELQTLVGGTTAELDIDNLRKNTQYGGLYEIGDDGQEHPTIKIFWEVMKELDDEHRRKVLKYVTSTPRAPLLGFGELNPKFSIRDSSPDETRLPSASTCVNLLKLPVYKSKAVLKDKLVYAINAGAGFDLS